MMRRVRNAGTWLLFVALFLWAAWQSYEAHRPRPPITFHGVKFRELEARPGDVVRMEFDFERNRECPAKLTPIWMQDELALLSLPPITGGYAPQKPGRQKGALDFIVPDRDDLGRPIQGKICMRVLRTDACSDGVIDGRSPDACLTVTRLKEVP